MEDEILGIFFPEAIPDLTSGHPDSVREYMQKLDLTVLDDLIDVYLKSHMEYRTTKHDIPDHAHMMLDRDMIIIQKLYEVIVQLIGSEVISQSVPEM